jgi:type VI secretion system protein ImpH
MAGKVGRSARDLTEEIGRDGPGFQFFQAVRLLALAQARGNVVSRTLRFRTPASLAFPASEILDVQTEELLQGDRAEDVANNSRTMHMTIGFLGLTGPSGALPTAYTELLMERRHVWRDDTAHRFFDMFTHRAASLFYAAWRKHRFYVGYEAGERDGFTQCLLGTVGAGLPSLRRRLQEEQAAISESLLVHFAGLLARKPISASAIAALLRGHFRIEAGMEQFLGAWIVLPVTEQSRLGARSCSLDGSACIGERVWDRQMKLRVRLGPLDAEQFTDFLPGAPGARLLEQLLRLCLGTSFACDAVLVLRKDAVPPPLLGPGTNSLRLGHNTWLWSDSPPANRDDARYRIIA